jgi:hypothetical protein
MAALFYLVGVASLVCWILTLVKMFNSAGVVQGIIGIICGLWAFIWGWIHAQEEGHTPVMLVWTILIILQIILQFTVMGGLEGAGPG